MKIAAGCFGCLAFLCLILAVVGSVAASAIISATPSDMQPMVASIVGWFPNAGGACCCLSGAVSIILLAVGMSRSNNDAIE